MPRERTGCVRERKVKDKSGRDKTLYYARVTYTDLSGKRKSVEKKAETRSQAKAFIRDILNDLDQHGTKSLDSARLTFTQLMDWYAERYIVPPKYVDGRKVSGMRSHQDIGYLKKPLIDFFGAARVRDLTYGDIEKFKQKRLDTPVVLRKGDGSVSVKRQRSIRSVHMELALLRRMLAVAVREGWITRSPFTAGNSLISEVDEVKRERILTREEEERLLAACEGKRAHLRPILICALDTGMRSGEIFKLVWSDVDLDRRIIHIQAFNTKTMKERSVPIGARLHHELMALQAIAHSPSALVFGIEDTVKRAFKTACQIADVKGFRLHDCRRAYATRMIQGGMAIEQVGRLLGHTNIITTYRYVNKAPETNTDAITILDRLNQP